MVLTVSFVLSPVTGLFCHRHQRKLPLANLTPASGRQDHTTSPSAPVAIRLWRIRVHRIPCRVDDVGQRPSVARDARLNAPDLPDGTSEIFSRMGLDKPIQKLPDGHVLGSPRSQRGDPFVPASN